MNTIVDSSFALLQAQVYQISILILLVGCVTYLIGRKRPHLSSVLWTLVIIKCVTPPFWSSPSGIFSWGQPANEQWLEELAEPPLVPATFIPDSSVASAASLPEIEVVNPPNLMPEVNLSHGSTVATVVQTSNVALQQSAPWILGVWLSGTGVLLALALARWTNCYRTLKRCRTETPPELLQMVESLQQRLKLRRPFSVQVTTSGFGPAVFGYFKPTLILPLRLLESQPLERTEPIIAHEMIHARRGDTAMGMLQFIAQIVWWFHPLVWWANRQMNRACEQCCDEEVVAGLRCRPEFYARCLLNVLELRHRLRPVLALSGIRSSEVTTQRMERLMKHPSRFRLRTPIWYWVILLVAAVVFLPGAGVFSRAKQQADQEPTSLGEADRAFAKQNWETAADGYREHVQRNPGNARSWFRLGYALHAAGKLDEAIEAHRKASQFQAVKKLALYNWACALALKGESELAISKLEEAIEAGFRSNKPLSEDTDFASVLDHPKFKELEEKTLPPGSRSVYRQLDFWVGHWDVFNAAGTRLGSNHITKDEQGFLLVEKWTGVGGKTGTSINYYDQAEEKWKQTWVDGNGNVTKYTGEFIDGSMQMKGKTVLANGQQGLSRLKLTPLGDGRVRHLIERSTDQGKTWRKYLVGFYVPKAANARGGPGKTDGLRRPIDLLSHPRARIPAKAVISAGGSD